MQRRPQFQPAEFLASHWQEKHLLLRDFFSNWQDLLSPEELAGLALEQDIESRLIVGTDPDSWSMRQGPFEETDFTSLPATGWTLLVQAVDQWLEEINQLKQQFSFIPSWRIEDVMVSYATAGAGVGPHFDQYDVFLVQGQGHRRWRIGQVCDDGSAVRDCSGMAILDQFEEQECFDLKPGDVLYIPPGIAHWGESLDESLCYSVGCRAPAMGELLLTLAELGAPSLPESARLLNQPSAHLKPGQISADELRGNLESLLQAPEIQSKFLETVGVLTTEPKYPQLIVPPEQPWQLTDLSELITQGLERNPHSRFAFSAEPSWVLYADSYRYSLESGARALAELLCSSEQLQPAALRSLAEDRAAAQLLLELLNEGSLVCALGYEEP